MCLTMFRLETFHKTFEQINEYKKWGDLQSKGAFYDYDRTAKHFKYAPKYQTKMACKCQTSLILLSIERSVKNLCILSDPLTNEI